MENENEPRFRDSIPVTVQPQDIDKLLVKATMIKYDIYGLMNAFDDITISGNISIIHGLYEIIERLSFETREHEAFLETVMSGRYPEMDKELKDGE